MVRSFSLLLVLAATGLVWGQQSPTRPQTAAPPKTTPSAPPDRGSSGEEIITVHESGSAGQKCRIVKTWTTPEGANVYQVQAMESGEMMTLVATSPTKTLGQDTGLKAAQTTIFHWGKDGTPPVGAPVPPGTSPKVTPTASAAPPPLPPKATPAPQPPLPPPSTKVVQVSTNPVTPPKPTTATPPAPMPSPEVPAVTTKPCATCPPCPACTNCPPRPGCTTCPPCPGCQPCATCPTCTTSQPVLKPIPAPVVKSTPAPLPMPSMAAKPLPTPSSPYAPVGKPSASPVTPVVALKQASRSSTSPYSGVGQADCKDCQPGSIVTTQGIEEARVVTPPTLWDRLTGRTRQPAPVSTVAPISSMTVISPPQVVNGPRTASPHQNITVVEQGPSLTPSGTMPAHEVMSPGVVTTGPVEIITSQPPPKPQRPSLFRSLFNRSSPPVVVPQEGSVVAQAPVVMPPSVTPSPLPPSTNPDMTKKPENVVFPVTKTTTEPAQPGDWRQSWGKPNGKPVAPSEVASHGGSPKEDKAAPFSPPLPVADSKRPDPLQDPESYLRRPLPEGPLMKRVEEPAASGGPAMPSDVVPGKPLDLVGQDKTVVANAVEPPAPMPVPAPTPAPVDLPPLPTPEPVPAPMSKPSEEPAAMPPVEAAPKPLVTPAEAAPTKPPLGTASVIAAGNVQYVPVPIVTVPDQRNLPRAPQPTLPRPPQPTGPPQGYSPQQGVPVDDELNAFSVPVQQQPHGMASNGFGQGRPQMPVVGGYPMPAQPVAPQQQGVMQAVAAQPTMTPVRTEQAVARMAEQTQGLAAPVALAVVALREALLPSEREMATLQLARCDWRSNGAVVTALVTAAQEDPAPSVRAACVRALARMNVNTVPVVSALQALKSDNDPRVQQEVTQALIVLAAGLANQEAQGVPPPQP